MTDDYPTPSVNGEPIVIRGVRRVESPQTVVPKILIEFDWEVEPRPTTSDVHISNVAIEGGLDTLTEMLVDRNLVPEWWAEGKSEPPSYE